jgi:hypothetical protein
MTSLFLYLPETLTGGLLMTETQRAAEFYIRKVLREVQAGKETKDQITEELRDHIASAIEEEADQKNPIAQVVKRMGSPRLVGKQYNKCYAVFKTPWDWFRQAAPYVTPFIPLWFIAYQSGSKPLWVTLVIIAFLAFFFGRLLGKKLIRWQACVWTAVLPLLFPLISLYLSIHAYGLFIHLPAINFADAMLSCVAWALIFSLGCFLTYGEAAFSLHRINRIKSAILAAAFILLCFCVGFGTTSLRQLGIFQLDAASGLYLSLAALAEEIPEHYDSAMPYDLADTMDIQINYISHHGYANVKRPFSCRSFLSALALFGDDFNAFRQSSYGDDPWKPILPVDLRLLPGLSDEARSDLIKETLRSLSDCYASFHLRGLGSLNSYHSPAQLMDFSDCLYEVEAGFYDALRVRTGQAKKSGILPDKLNKRVY